MKAKRWSVWMWVMMVTLGLSDLRAQDFDDVINVDEALIDDVSKLTPKAVSSNPTSRVAHAKQIQIEAQVVELRLDQLPALKNEATKRDRLDPLAKKLGWIEQHRGMIWKSKNGLNLKASELDVEKFSKVLTMPKLIVLEGQEASFLSGGELPVIDPDHPEKPMGLRQIGVSMKCVATVRRDGRVRLDLRFENSNVVAAKERFNWLNSLKSLTQVAADPLKEPELPAVVSQAASFVADFVANESLIMALAAGANGVDNVTLVCVTPSMIATGDDANLVQTAPPKPMRFTGQGINSSAGVTGQVVLDDAAIRTKLEASQISVDIPKATVLGQVGSLGALLLVSSAQFDSQVRVVVPHVVLSAATKAPKTEVGDLSRSVTLKIPSPQDFETIRDWNRTEGDLVAFVALPESQEAREQALAHPTRLFEHAYVRAMASRPIDQDASQRPTLVEVQVGQKVVRVPANRVAYLLLPTPQGNSLRYASVCEPQARGIKPIGDLTVIFVTEQFLELQALIGDLEPTAKVTLVEVRDAVLLRGTATSDEQKKSLVELAEQFYPKVLNQLRVETKEALRAEARRDNALHQPLVVQPSSSTIEFVDGAPAQERSKPATPPARETAKADSAKNQIQRVSGEHSRSRLPSLEELRQLREEVQGLRRDVQRLTESLKQPTPRVQPQTPQENQRSEVPPAIRPMRREPQREASRTQPADLDERRQSSHVAKVYAVADLVVPIGPMRPNDATQRAAQLSDAATALRQLITYSVEPDTWSEAGGSSSIVFNDATLSFVIRATNNVHAEIADLLGQLRRLQDLQVSLEMSIVTLHASQVPREINGSNKSGTHTLKSPALQALVKSWQTDRRSNIVMSPKITLMNGQTATVNSDELNTNLIVNGVVSGDRKSVRLALGINGDTLESVVRRQQLTLEEGQSLVLDITSDISAPAKLLKKLPITADAEETRTILKNLNRHDGQRVLLLVTPRVITTEAEETLR